MEFNPDLESEGGLLGKGLGQCFRGVAILLALAAFGTEALAAEAANAIPYRAAPGVTLDQVDRTDGPNVFDTVAVPIRAQPTSTRWAKIMRASLNQPALLRLAVGAWELPPIEQAAYVQSMVSYAVRNGSSSYDCSDDGYWAAAGETLTRGMGDCIDIAVAKMEALRLLGIPKEDLYLTTGYVRKGAARRGVRESAALLVRIGNDFWLLPEKSGGIVKASGHGGATSHFTPVLTYGVGKTWIHGRTARTAMVGN